MPSTVLLSTIDYRHNTSYSGRIIVTFVPGGIWYPPENIPFPFPTTVAPLSKISGNAIF